VEKILVIQTAFLGDAILTLPMIQKLKEKFSNSEIDVLCIPSTREIFDASPVVNLSIIIDKRGKQKHFLSFYRFVKELKKENYTRIYSPHRSFRSALIVKFLSSEKSFGFSNSAFKEAYTNVIKYDTQKHEIQKNLDLAQFSYDSGNWRIIPELNLQSELKKPLEDFFVNYTSDSKIYAFAPGSVWNTKKYPMEYFEKIIRHFVEKNKFVILIGGEADRVFCENIASKFNEGVFSAAGKFSVLESIKILEEVEILISNDSAPTHLGMCADIPVLTIYCSTVPAFGFYPYNNKSSYISFDDLSCKPCGIHGHKNCPVGTFDCAYKLLPENIIMKVESMLND